MATRHDEDDGICASPLGSDASFVSSSASALSSSPRRGNKKRQTIPRDKNGLGYNFFWGVLLFSFYWNVHFVLLRLTSTTNHPHHGTWNHMELHNRAAKNAFLNRQRQQQADSDAQPFVSLNLTTELEGLVNLESAEMLLKTAFASLLHDTAKTMPYRFITNVVPRKRVKRKDYDVDDFTLTTHATVAQLDRLLQSYIAWGGPASATVHVVNYGEIDVFLAFIHDKGRILKDIAIHVVLEDVSFWDKSSSATITTTKSPTSSVLRKLAISQLETDFFVDLNVDFVTNKGAHEQLRNLLKVHDNFFDVLKNKTLMVLPAFAAMINDEGNKDTTMRHQKLTFPEPPAHKNELIKQYSTGLVEPFHLAQFPQQHGPTQFSIWLENQESSDSFYYPITYQPQFEPFVLAYRHGLPRYWTGFRGHFYNQSSWMAESHQLGFRLAVLRDFFVVYLGAASSTFATTKKWKSREWQNFLDYKDRVHTGKNETASG